MTDFIKQCSIHIPDNARDQQGTYGYIPEFTALPMGGALMRDLEVAWAGDDKSAANYFPMNPVRSKVSVVAVISDIFWDTSRTGSISISCQMSPANISRLRMGQVDLAKFGFYITEFDINTKRHFGCFNPVGAGIVETRIVGLETAHERSSETRYASYTVQFEAAPAGAAKTLMLGVADGKTLVRPWGG